MYPFAEGSFAVRNGWYVAAFPHEVTRKLLTRWILNEPVVLYRKENGDPVAVGGRCPHRHFPHGQSKLIGDDIQCGYHGITFGADGRCTRIPSQTAIPSVYRIPTYPLVEEGLWLWIWMGDPDLADHELIPNPDEIGLREPDLVYRAFYSYCIKGRYQLLNDNLLDLSHLAILHGASIGTAENAGVAEARDQTERRLRSRRNMKRAACPPFVTQKVGYSGPVDRISGMDFFFPGLHAGLDETRIFDEADVRAGELLVKGRVFHAVTPSTFDETLYFFASGAATERDLDLAYEVLKPVVDEDVFATAEIEKMLQRTGTPPAEFMLKSDTTAVLGRKILQTMMDKELSNRGLSSAGRNGPGAAKSVLE
jgi:vanillate O-demethylase monooxygenase subunit